MILTHERLFALTGRLPLHVVDREEGDHRIPYLERYYLGEFNGMTYFIHRFVASDPDGLHDHPWDRAYSIILLGKYLEQVPPTGAAVYTEAVRRYVRDYPEAANTYIRQMGQIGASKAFNDLDAISRNAFLQDAANRLEAQGVYDYNPRTRFVPRKISGADRHRVLLQPGEEHVWTLFVVGAKTKKWGQFKGGVYTEQSGRRQTSTGQGATPRDWPKGRSHPDRVPLWTPNAA